MVTLVRIPKRLQTPELKRQLPKHVNFRDRTGEPHEGCQVLGFAGLLPPGHSAWLCKCECGKLFLAQPVQLNRPSTTCGCRSAGHRLSRSYFYKLWRSMIAKCHDSADEFYRYYGAKGVKVCQRWRESVERFAEDLGPRPAKSFVVGRLNTARDFTPANCRWVPKSEKEAYVANYTAIEHNGERLGIAAWAKRLGISHQALRLRLAKCAAAGVDVSLALSTAKYAHDLSRAASSRAKRNERGKKRVGNRKRKRDRG